METNPVGKSGKSEGKRIGGAVAIYTLSDPRTGSIRYVGKATDPTRRLSQHLRQRADQNMTPVREWVAGLALDGVKPVMSVVEWCGEHEWKCREVEQIKAYRDAGNDLLNVARGGNEPFCSIETRRENGRRSKDHPEKWLFVMLRKMHQAVRDAKLIGDDGRVTRFTYLIELINASTGEMRRKFVALAESHR